LIARATAKDAGGLVNTFKALNAASLEELYLVFELTATARRTVLEQ